MQVRYCRIHPLFLDRNGELKEYNLDHEISIHGVSFITTPNEVDYMVVLTTSEVHYLIYSDKGGNTHLLSDALLYRMGIPTSK